MAHGWDQVPLPEAPMTESAVLAALMRDRTAFDPVYDAGLRPEHFYDPLMGRLYAELYRRYASGEGTDAVHIRAWLEMDPDIDKVGGAAKYLPGLLMAPTSAKPDTLRQYVDQLHDFWKRRRLIVEAEQAIVQARALREPIGETVAALTNAFDDIAAGEGGHLMRTFGEVMESAYDQIMEAGARGGPAGLTIRGFPTLAKYVQLRPEENTILAGVNGSGKTALGWAWLVDIARTLRERLNDGELLEDVGGVAGVSLEMTGEALAQRTYAAMAGVPLADVMSGLLTDYQKESLGHAKEEAKGLPMIVIEGAGMTAAQIKMRLVQAKRKFKGKLNVCLVDHVIQVDSSGTDAEHGGAWATAKVADELMRLTKRGGLNCHMLGLCQVNDDLLNKLPWDKRRPTRNMLQWSKRWGNNADHVIGINRPAMYLDKSRPEEDPMESPADYAARLKQWEAQWKRWENAAELYLDKNRHGEGNIVIPLLFEGKTVSFTEDPKYYPKEEQP